MIYTNEADFYLLTELPKSSFTNITKSFIRGVPSSSLWLIYVRKDSGVVGKDEQLVAVAPEFGFVCCDVISVFDPVSKTAAWPYPVSCTTSQQTTKEGRQSIVLEE